MQYEKFILHHDVSRETFQKLSDYADLLTRWNKSVNLVAQGDDLWKRHILDSAQLAKHIPPNTTIADLGSGGGLPGIVLAILLTHPITLVESDRKKSIFLNQCRQLLDLHNATIINERIEAITLKADVIAARALASTKQLLYWSSEILGENGICLFLKGANFAIECEEAKKEWAFEVESIASKTGDGAIIKLSRIQRYDT